ncbi:MAG: c-type cytochrome domain-containing protein, partial [Acidobacteriota bacterium]
MRIIVFVTLAAGIALAETPVDFQRQVRPILSDNCFHCHGPDRTTRMANLRLDTREGAFAPRKQGAAIVPGQPAASLILERIRHQDPARVMPPPQSHKKISAQQQQILTRWIAQGAPWQEHWAFQQPAKPSLPTVRNTQWPRSPLD